MELRGTQPGTVVGLLALVVMAGCLTGGPGAPTPTSDRPSADEPGSATPGSNASTVEYVVRAGEVPPEFAEADATVAVVLVDRARDLGPCYRGVHRGPFKPTPTPVPTPAGDCHRPAVATVDLTDLTGNRTIGPVGAPHTAAGHALVLADLQVTRRNGRTVGDVKHVGGAELLSADGRPSGRYVVTLSVEAVDADRRYDYRLTWEVSRRSE